MRKLIILACISSLFIFLVSCDRDPATDAKQAMRKTRIPKNLSDDLGLKELAEGINENVEILYHSDAATLTFGPKELNKDDYILSMYYLTEKINIGLTKKTFYNLVKDKFDFYEVYGKDDWGDVFITSYFEPVLIGSRRKTEKYSQPLYATPNDLVNFHLGKFSNQFEKMSPIKGQVLDPRTNLSIIPGRITPAYNEGTSKNIVPYYSREEIDGKGVLEGKRLELAWVDPVDAFFLQVQGSGTVRFTNGKEIRLGYAAKNGHPYVGIGKLLYHKISKEEMTMQALEKHLRSLSPEERQKILFQNPSYVFFREIEGRPVTHSGAEVVDGRTIATDKSFYPKGTLAFMEFPRPTFSDEFSTRPNTWVTTSRFVLDQDTGGAIRGPHRVDLFWGTGEDAAQHAGVLKNWGKLFYLVPKDEFVEELKSN